jgi:hypothetical protein
MADMIRNILQVVNPQGMCGVIVIERDRSSNVVSVTVTSVDPDNGNIDVEKGIVHDVYDTETRKHLSVWDFNTAEAPSNV